MVLRQASEVENILQHFKIELAPTIDSAQIPQADNLTTLPSIVGRIIGASDSAVSAAQDRHNTESSGETFEKYMPLYKRKPFIHCEVCVQEYFYEMNYSFLGGDCDIYCSKPSYFCCKLYFEYHPARIVVPDSHEKIYPKWVIPLSIINLINIREATKSIHIAS